MKQKEKDKMKRTINSKKYIVEEFYIGKANYYLGDGNGVKIRMLLDYKNNTYKLFSSVSKSQTGKGSVCRSLASGDKSCEGTRELKKQATKIAKDLLTRKAGINLTSNLRRKGII